MRKYTVTVACVNNSEVLKQLLVEKDKHKLFNKQSFLSFPNYVFVGAL